MLAGWTRTIGLGLALGLAWPSSGLAAPPADDAPADEPPAIDPEIMARVASLYDDGQNKFDLSDHAAALELWTEAYELLPNEPAYDDNRAFLRLVLANGHKAAYSADEDLAHLRKAEELFVAHLEWLDPSDEVGRFTVETELDEVRATIEAIEDERARQQQELIDAEAKAREDAARQAEFDRAAELRRKEAEEQRRKYRTFTIVGGSLLGLGGASAGVMIAGLALGQGVDRRGDEANTGMPIADEQYQDTYDQLLAQGRSYNRMAVASGVIAGVSSVAGAVLVAVAAVKWKPHEQEAETCIEARLELAPGGLALRF